MIDSAAEVRRKLKALAGAKPVGSAFLTATLSTSRLDDWRPSAPSFLHSEFNRRLQEDGTSREEKRLLQYDLEYILEVVNHEITPQTQGLAVFVDGRGGYHERIELPFRLLNRLVIEPTPHIRPVAHALSLLEPFVVARVSRDESSLLLVDEWGVAHEDDVAGPWLRWSDRETGEVSIKEYFAAARQDQLVELHYKEVGVTLAKLLEASQARRVVVCAQHEIATSFRRALAQPLAGHVVAEIPLDAGASTKQMVAHARLAVEQARNREIAALAARIKEGLGLGGHGVSGFADVLGALTRHQLQVLLVDRDYRVPGWTCARCGWTGLDEVKICPTCGGHPVRVDDAVGETVRLAILQGSQLEVGENIPVLQELGGVAGLLRYA